MHRRPPGAVVWLTGLSGSGKSTVGDGLHNHLRGLGHATVRLDGDQLRAGLCADLGFSQADRAESVRRAGEVAALMAESGLLVIASLISPFQAGRLQVRKRVAPAPFLEVYCDTPLAVCEARDPKGLYQRVRAGQIAEFTGVSSPYEAPKQPDLRLATAETPPAACIEQLTQVLRDRGLLLQPEVALEFRGS